MSEEKALQEEWIAKHGVIRRSALRVVVPSWKHPDSQAGDYLGMSWRARGDPKRTLEDEIRDLAADGSISLGMGAHKQRKKEWRERVK